MNRVFLCKNDFADYFELQAGLTRQPQNNLEVEKKSVGIDVGSIKMHKMVSLK